MAGSSMIGNLSVLLTLETAAFEKGSSHASKLLRKTQRQFEDMGRKIGDVGKGMSVAITAPLAGFGALAIKEATEAGKAMGQVNAALTSMGNGAGRSAEQLKAAADAFEMSSLYEGDEILTKVTANMLTFGSVATANFDRAQQAAIDLSTRMGTDLQSSTLMIGKALNEPVKGLAALRRVGIQFTEQQQEQIKAMAAVGDTAGAQAVMLGELESQFGGAAQAAQNADPFNKANDAFKQMAETVGTALLPIIPVLTDAVVSVANAFSNLSPATQKWLIIGGGIAAALGPVLIAVGGLVSVTGSLLPLLLKLGPAFKLVQAGFLIMKAAALTSLPALAPFLLPLGAIALAVGAVYLAFKNWDKITAIAKALYTGVKTWVLDKLNAVWNGVKAGIDKVKGFFHGLWDAVVGHSYIPDMVTGIGVHIARLDALMVAPIKKGTEKATEAFRKMSADIRGLLDRLFPEVAKRTNLVADLALLDKAGLDPKQLSAARRRRLMEENPLGEVTPIAEPLQKVIEQDLPNFGDAAEATTVRVAKSFEDMVRNVSSSIKGFVDAIKGGGILDILTSALDVFLTLGSAGLFGSGIQTNLNKSYANRANGGPVFAGRTYMVGERGKEFFTPSQSGYIKPNNDNGRSQPIRVLVDTSDLLTARIVQGDKMAMMGGAAGGQARMMRQASRRLPTNG